MFNTLWLLIFTLPAVEQYLPTFRFQVKDDNFCCDGDSDHYHHDKNDVFEDVFQDGDGGHYHQHKNYVFEEAEIVPTNWPSESSPSLT